MKKNLLLLLTILLAACTSVKEIQKPPKKAALPELLSDMQNLIKENKFSIKFPKGSEFTKYEIDSLNNEIIINANKEFSFQPFREDNVNEIYNSIKDFLGDEYSRYKIVVKSLGTPIEELIPNFYRKKIQRDTSRLFTKQFRPLSIVRNISKPYYPTKGLYNRNIALWASHGRYYNKKLDRWMWQRARLFQTVEDLGPTAFVIPYLIPMLENAGANVFTPRERDIQTSEVIVDNDDNSDSFVLQDTKNNKWKIGEGSAFAFGSPPYKSDYNPFEHGTHLIIRSENKITATATYIPNIPKDGEYAVYVSYHSSDKNVNDAHYTVYHAGGKTEFEVNQQIGGSTWIYLGKSKFKKGVNPSIGKVVVDNKSDTPGKLISVDAVRFGGGMGIIERNGKTSGLPKFMEGARYFLQFSGMPDTLVYNLNGDTLDYNDDYQSRGEWVNYLTGAPYGPNKDRKAKGLGIPIDLSLAFHTDAGVNQNDSTIGTLSIYSIPDFDSNKVFPDGTSRLANRDLADILQTQIVNDLREKYDSLWTRRALRDAMYSEAARPNVPSVLLELLSHQNYYDCKFQLDPRFRFDVCRAIYKAMVKFIASEYNTDYVIQPLPVTDFYTELDQDGNIKLSWRPQLDELEPTAIPKKYIVYRRIGDGGFDNGTLVDDTTYTFTDTKKNVIYSFKVTAVNEGGESFPSEVLSACSFGKDKQPVLIVNGFDRIAPPYSVESKNFTGFLNIVDPGVPDKYDLGFTGYQHNFDPSINWTSDDMPGLGASYADYESKIIAGNSFDYPFIHGKTIVANGYSFVSSSDEAVWNGYVNLSKYKFVDFIMGEEKETPWQSNYANIKYGEQFKAFPYSLQKKISEYLNSGGNIFVSGSYIGTDLFWNKGNDNKDVVFGKNYLRYKLSTDHAVRIGKVYANSDIVFPNGFEIDFNTSLNDSIYAVSAPDALGEINGSKTILRYSESDTGAGVAYKENYGVVAFGFPFETILDYKKQTEVMKYILNYLIKN
ncbi:fibronectin type III domain-containing protein [Melioribacteraceae bacterium 4301-Me]|uniref:golvesin C-terminal-like domain-containing protein n=1 Tax=Pyranulibacter aquaticus TaxID=3163344 RepID=UPI0035993745